MSVIPISTLIDRVKSESWRTEQLLLDVSHTLNSIMARPHKFMLDHPDIINVHCVDVDSVIERMEDLAEYSEWVSYEMFEDWLPDEMDTSECLEFIQKQIINRIINMPPLIIKNKALNRGIGTQQSPEDMDRIDYCIRELIDDVINEEGFPTEMVALWKRKEQLDGTNGTTASR